MKMKISAFLVMTLAVASAFAQNSSTVSMPTTSAEQYDGGVSSEGFRVSFLKPASDMKLDMTIEGMSGSGSATPSSSVGFAAGYAKLPIHSLGFTANAAYEQFHSEATLGAARIDGNLAYTFNKYLNVKGGLNFFKFVSGDVVNHFNPGFGFQASLGVQMTKNFGLDFGYSESHTSGTVDIGLADKADVEMKISGFEAAMNATF